MEYYVYHIDEALRLFGEDKNLSKPKQISLWAKQLLIHKIQEKGLQFDTEINYSKEGKPFFVFNSSLQFSISHTNNYIAIAFCEKSIGIDIEKERKSKLEIANRFFHPKEAEYLRNIKDKEEQNKAFTKIWTIKESYVKCIGTGIANNFKSFYIELPESTLNQIPTIHNNSNLVKITSIYDKETKLFISICKMIEN
jgi:4'-phosphopantetheinyl transferase